MNRPCLNSRFHLRISLLLLLLISPGLAAEIPLRAYTASYDLHKSGIHLATSEISLQREDRLWRWRTTTSARGIYAWIINNEITSETTFIQAGDEIRLQQVLNKDSGDKKKYELASFDWDKGSIEVLRKGKHKQLPLHAEVYDYHSIHLLAVSMRMRQLDKATVDFYRKGRLTRSDLVYSGTGNIDINGKTMIIDIFEQAIVKSSSMLKYYYAAENPLLLLRVEKQKPGKSPVTLTLRKVEWNL